MVDANRRTAAHDDAPLLPLDSEEGGGPRAEPPGSEAEAASGPTYAAALAELEAILASLEGSTVDVDLLADRVARGVELVRFCQQRLREVRTDVDAVIVELVDDTADR